MRTTFKKKKKKTLLTLGQKHDARPLKSDNNMIFIFYNRAKIQLIVLILPPPLMTLTIWHFLRRPCPANSRTHRDRT